jgi:hypothetical protein
MKYKNNLKPYRRRIGQSRKSQSIYDNLGHPFEIKDKLVVFIGKEEKAYSLTNGKVYKIVGQTSGKSNFDHDLYTKCKNMDSKNYTCSQGEDYFIIIINDLGHKRKYSHLMFEKLKQEVLI